MVGQTAIVNRLLWMQNHYPLTGEDVVAQKTPCSFDVSVWEFFWPFIAGAKLVILVNYCVTFIKQCDSCF